MPYSRLSEPLHVGWGGEGRWTGGCLMSRTASCSHCSRLGSGTFPRALVKHQETWVLPKLVFMLAWVLPLGATDDSSSWA